ncbi:hypothetical protein CVT24_009522 [Panaeolus cyanescens]|uniref:Uncharacterized protein n=1 Tax=Panaeolus cyanescens TaxID=181874 RepID=A0A409X129_9AGAR|nr:hypothetical protein CVT24_009522 [Panaeolus cyanescens]
MRKESNAEKRRRLQELLLTEAEWETVSKFCNLLQVADDAQHAFSAAARPTLHNALPAIEKMYSKWEKASEMVEYARFKPALAAGMQKIEEYYERTAASCMALDPRKKFAHFERNWGTDLANDVKLTVQTKAFVDIQAFSDASTGFGIGICVGERWRAWHLLPKWRTRDGAKHIGWAEAVGFYLLVSHISSCLPPATHFRVFCDNEGVVGGWRNGRSRNRNPADGPSRGVYPASSLILPPIPVPDYLQTFIADVGGSRGSLYPPVVQLEAEAHSSSGSKQDSSCTELTWPGGEDELDAISASLLVSDARLWD